LGGGSTGAVPFSFTKPKTKKKKKMELYIIIAATVLIIAIVTTTILIKHSKRFVFLGGTCGNNFEWRKNLKGTLFSGVNLLFITPLYKVKST
jgi:hypothetical protein